MSDLIAGTSFTNGQMITANDLNELVGSASLDLKVIDKTHLKDEFFTGLDEVTSASIRSEDLLIIWSPSQNKFLKIRKEEFDGDLAQATSLSNDYIGIQSTGQIFQKKDVINLFGTEEDAQGNVNASNAIVLRSADKTMLIAPMVGTGLTLEVQGDIKANGYQYADGTSVSSGGGSSTSAFTFSGSTLTMVSSGVGTATFTVNGTTLTITT